MFEIVQAELSDAPEIQKLLTETWQDTYSDHLSPATLAEVAKNWQSIEFLTKQITNPSFYFPVAKKDNQIVGLATAHMPEDAIILFRLYIYPKHQHQGIGGQLLEDVVKHFPKAKKVQLYAEEMNPKGPQFYKKHGFKEIRREPQKVVTEVINQILMEKVL